MLTGSLRGFSGEKVQVKGHETLETTCGEDVKAKAINVIYLIVDAPLSYNIIIGHPSINAHGSVISINYLVLKHALPGWKFSIISGGQVINQ